MISYNKYKTTLENQETYEDEKQINVKTSTPNLKIKRETEGKTVEYKQLQEKLTKAMLSIEQLENMTKAVSERVSQLENEFQENEKEHRLLVEKKYFQIEYETKEINSLKAELEDLQKMLEKRNEELDKAQNQNVILKNEITANRYKIFHMHFNALQKLSSDQCSSLNSSVIETSSDNSHISKKSSTAKSSELSDDT